MEFRLFSKALPFLTIALFACKKSETPQTVLAQVDQSRYTLEEIRENFPAEMEKVLTREQYLGYLKQWAEDEVIYLQALKQKIQEDAKVAHKMKNMQRKVLIEEFLARESKSEDYEPDEGLVSRYFEMHKEAFRRQTPEFRFLQLRVGTLNEAQSLRSQIKGDNFSTIAIRYSLDSTTEFSTTHPFRKASEIPACMFEGLSNAKPGFLSEPLICPDGFYLIKLLERMEAGTPISLVEAKDAIISQLTMDHKDKMRATKIRQYKEGAAISFNLDLIPGIDPNTALSQANPPISPQSMEKINESEQTKSKKRESPKRKTQPNSVNSTSDSSIKVSEESKSVTPISKPALSTGIENAPKDTTR